MTGLADRVNLFGGITAIVETICEIGKKNDENVAADCADLSADDVEFEDISTIVETICEISGKKNDENVPADCADLSADDVEFEDISTIVETICEISGKKKRRKCSRRLRR